MSFVETHITGNIDLIRRVFEDGGVCFKGSRGSALCPFHDDRQPSFSANLTTSAWMCHGCGEKGDLVSFVAKRRGISVEDAIAELKSRLGAGGPNPAKPSVAKRTRFACCSPDGTVVAVHIREELGDGSKRFRWERDGKVGLNGLRSADVPLFGSERLAICSGDGVVIVTEGEKAASALINRGFNALGTVGGAATVPSDEALQVLWGRDVLLWPDNDQPGRRHMESVAGALLGRVKRLQVLSWGNSVGDDAHDFFDGVESSVGLTKLIDEAPDWKGPTESGSGGQEAGAVMICLSDVVPEKVSWLWEGRVPFGKVTVIDGDPGLGKSMLTLDLAARLTTGREFPGGGQSAIAGVVILSVEDGLADTVRPRLEAAGADLGRIVALTGVRDEDGLESLPTLDLNIFEIEQAIERCGAALVIIDPLMAYLGGTVNSFRDQDIRRVLAPLAAMAERREVAVVAVRHLRKSKEGGAINSGGGSIGIIGAARSGLMVGKDPNDDARRVVAPVKSNLGPPPASLAYRIGAGEKGLPRILWDSTPVSISAEQLLAASAAGEEERSAVEEAVSFLEAELMDGKKASDKVVEAARKAGISASTLRRAKTRLGVVSEKQGFEGGWVLVLPLPKAATSQPKMSIAPIEHLGPSKSIFGPATWATPDAAETDDGREACKTSGQSPGRQAAKPCSYHCGPAAAPCTRCSVDFAGHAIAGGGQ